MALKHHIPNTACHWVDTCAVKFHCRHIWLLPPHINFAHVDCAVETKFCTRRGCSKSMLSGPCFRYDSFFAHAFCKEALSNRVVDFVRTSVCKSLQLDVNLCAPQKFCRGGCKVKRGLTSDIVAPD